MHDNKPQHLFTRRSLILGALGAGLLGGVIARLGYLQLLKKGYYALLSDDNRISLRFISPKRGKIRDRWGSVLAYDIKSFRAVMNLEILDINKISLRPYLEKLALVLDFKEEDISRILKEKKKTLKFIPLLLKDNIPWSDVAKIELGLLEMPGVSVEETTRRFYPFKEMFSHLIGYVGIPSEEELKDGEGFLNGQLKTGKSGLEKIFDMSLRGEPGLRKIEVNARGKAIRDLSQENPIEGEDLISTVDLDLQQRLMEELSPFSSAAGVLMDIHSGDILALGSQPSYDPNLFSENISKENWQALQKDPFTPLINKAIGGLYAPGSTFKMCVALAALEEGVIDERTSSYCTGHMMLGNHKFHCWKKEAHGRVALREAFQHSCDIYFWEVGKRVGIEAIALMAKRLGLGGLSSLGLKGEKSGVIPTKDWKLGRFGQSWYMGDTFNAAIGQGYVLSTPLELAVMTARLASGGKLVVPRLSLQEASPNFVSLGLQEKHINLILEGMSRVCNEPGGTAYRHRITEPGFLMGGKTGTSQVRRISLSERAQGVRKTHELDWKLRNHSLFVGFAPIEAPRYAISILIEHGGDGLNSVPIGQKLLLAAQKRDFG